MLSPLFPNASPTRTASATSSAPPRSSSSPRREGDWTETGDERAMSRQPNGFGRCSHPNPQLERATRSLVLPPVARCGTMPRSLPGRRASEGGLPGRSRHSGSGRGAAAPPTESGSQVHPPPVPSSRSSALSAKRQRQILAVLLGAFALLTAASVATFHRPLAGDPPWESANACGPVGAVLAWALAWTFGHAAALLVPVLAGGDRKSTRLNSSH